MTDCLIIGHNDVDFKKIARLLKSLGEESGDYKNRSLCFIEKDDMALRALDIFNYFAFGPDYQSMPNTYYNADFLQPAVAVLGSYLIRYGQFSVDVVNSYNREKDLLRQKLANDEILSIVITTTFYLTSEPITEIISFIRSYNKKAKIILGGPYIASLIANNRNHVLEILPYLEGDFYIESSEGERSLCALVGALKNDTPLSAVPNLYYRSGGSYAYSFKDVEKNELQENTVMWDSFTPYLNEFASIRTAKSCPFKCAFCGFPARLGEYVYTDLKWLEVELNRLKDMNISTLSYIDDTFNVPKARFKDLMRMKIANKYNFKWNSFFRCDFGDEETVALMRDSGCEGVFLGIESGSARVLESMNKALRPHHVRKMVPLLRQAGVLTYASLIVGFPGETEETFQETMNLISEVKPDFFRVQLWYCDRATPVWKDREKHGLKGEAFNWSHNTMNVKTAIRLVESAFLTQYDSTWLPEDSFEFWSVFYLQRKGYSLAQIKHFADKFRVTIAKQKLLKKHFSAEDINTDLQELRQIVLHYDDWQREKGHVNIAEELAPGMSAVAIRV